MIEGCEMGILLGLIQEAEVTEDAGEWVEHANKCLQSNLVRLTKQLLISKELFVPG